MERRADRIFDPGTQDSLSPYAFTDALREPRRNDAPTILACRGGRYRRVNDGMVLRFGIGSAQAHSIRLGDLRVVTRPTKQVTVSMPALPQERLSGTLS
jgi:hypothetical protein